jgi:hypothetical protein
METKLHYCKTKFKNSFLLSLFLVFSFCSTFAQTVDFKKTHYSAKNVMLFDKSVYNLNEFTPKVKKNVPLDVLKLIDESYLDHPDLGYSVHPIYKDAIELVDKKDEYHSTYINAEGKAIFSASAEKINYIDANGKYRTVDFRLDPVPVADQLYVAKHQDVPKSIDANSGKTGFQTGVGQFYVNQNTKLKFYFGETLLAGEQSLNLSNKTLGENGLFITDAYPNIDMQIILTNSANVKTNYIIKDRNAINQFSDFTVFEDIITVPAGLSFNFENEMGIYNGNGEDWDGEIAFRNQEGTTVFQYGRPFIYDDNYTNNMFCAGCSMTRGNSSEASQELSPINDNYFGYASYRVEKINETTYKVSVVVNNEWLLAEDRVFPVVIDPVTFSSASANLGTSTGPVTVRCHARITGTTPSNNPIVDYPAGCTSLNVTILAGYMLLPSPVTFNGGYYSNGCAMSNSFIRYYGPCGVDPREAGFFWFCNSNFAGTCNAVDIPATQTVSRCALVTGGEDCDAPSPPSCTNRTIQFTTCRQTRCSGGTAPNCYPTSGSPAVWGFGTERIDVYGERILATIRNSANTTSLNVCPNSVNPINFSSIRNGVPISLNTANCTDQMGGSYAMSYTATGGTLTSGPTNTTAGSATGALSWTAPATPGTYTVTTKVCGNCSGLGDALNCVTQALTFIVGDAIAPIVADVDACNSVNGVATISNPQTGYTYTWYTNATGTTGAATGTSRSYAFVNGTTQTYSVRATSPCASSLTTFTITWGPLPVPVGVGDTKCPGQIASLSADCGANCRWYTTSSGGTSINNGSTLTVNPVTGTVTYYVENYVSAGCISVRTPITLSTNALTVTTNPTSFNPLCTPSTAQFTSSVTGNTDIGSVVVCNNGSEIMNDNSPCTGPDCTTANSGLLSVSTPANAINIQQVCFQMNGTAWCGNETRFYLRSPDGTVFTLYGGRAKNDKSQDATNTYCFSDAATATVTAPTMGAGVKIANGTYRADGGTLSTAFAAGNFTAGSTWSVIAVDPVSGGCGSGTASISNVCVTYGVTSPPTYSWSGTPGSLSSTTISNPVYTPPATNYSGTYTVTVTDAVGCTGTATVTVGCVLLPVELLSFYGDVGDNYNHLYWKTASEIETNHFEVERSSDGNNFTTIGKVNATGNSLTLQNYSFEDKVRNDGLNYYRLKIVDEDGKYKHSGIIALTAISKDVILEVVPNPASEYIDILYSLERASETEIKIYDPRGAIIYSTNKSSIKGINSSTLKIDNFAKGIYNVVLINGGIVSTSRFVKQ